MNWPRTPAELKLELASFGTRYITSTPTTHVGIESLHINCRGADNREPIIASLPSNEQQTLVLLLLRAFRGFLWLQQFLHWGNTPQYMYVYIYIYIGRDEMYYGLTFGYII
jgi:hypothetical protein